MHHLPCAGTSTYRSKHRGNSIPVNAGLREIETHCFPLTIRELPLSLNIITSHVKRYPLNSMRARILRRSFDEARGRVYLLLVANFVHLCIPFSRRILTTLI